MGKVFDVFAGHGVNRAIPASGNAEISLRALQAFRGLNRGLVFATLVDLDMLYGHRNDTVGYARALKEFDLHRKSWARSTRETYWSLPPITATTPPPQVPTTSREYVPLLLAGPQVRPVVIGTRPSMADLGATLAGLFGVPQGDGTPIPGVFV